MTTARMEDKALTVASGKEKEAMELVPKGAGMLGEIDPYWERTFDKWPWEAQLRHCEILARAADAIPVMYRGQSGKIFFAAQLGARLKLNPSESIARIMVVNGVPSIWGDFMFALIRASGKMESHDEWYEIDGVRVKGDDFNIVELEKAGKRVVAFVAVKRTGEPEYVKSYSIEDAKIAGLWGKKDSWIKSPKEMMMWRPRSFVGRRKFQDVLMGFDTVEVSRDYSIEEANAIAAASQVETKGAELAEKLAEGTDAGGLSQATIEEIEMLESMLNACAVGKAEEIRKDLRIVSDQLSIEQATLYVRAMGLAVDQVNAERDRVANGGSLL